MVKRDLRAPDFRGIDVSTLAEWRELRFQGKASALFVNIKDVPKLIERATATLRAERDAAFAMSRCECSADEACANLAALHAELEASRAKCALLAAEVEGLRAALTELLEAETALCPTFEEGSAAQSKWALRSFDARTAARAALSSAAAAPNQGEAG